MGHDISTKASTLEYLSSLLRRSIVDKFLTFTLSDWQSASEKILTTIQNSFSDQLIIVRSSATDEDRLPTSKAGYYHSEANVLCNDRDDLMRAISRVVNSYSKTSRIPSLDDQVLIQPQIRNVIASGVVFTRDPYRSAPYYVVNYDDSTGRTDTVTRGLSSCLLRLARWREAVTLVSPWDKLILAIQELEQIYEGKPLDIEFAIDQQGQVHIFQVRQLSLSVEHFQQDDRRVEASVSHLGLEFERISSKVHNLAGSYTILGDMPDWNPAEIIGGRPNPLDYSLYRFLITKSIWNKARVSLGYKDVAPSELMVLLADKPYIDARVSFNSLTPSSLSTDLREELINYYLDKLANSPELQDKVEFKILFTCFDLSFYDRTRELLANGISKADIDYLEHYLKAFTNSLLQGSEKIIRYDLEAIDQLERSHLRRHDRPSSHWPISFVLQKADQLLAECQELGALPFSRLARLAFVGITMLRSLLEQEVISQELYHSFLNSIETVASQLRADFLKLAEGKLSLELFMERYGHLRPGTYNVLAPRYDQIPDFFESLQAPKLEPATTSQHEIDRTTTERIDYVLARHGIQYSSQRLFNFIRQTLAYREYAKFEFTRNLSDAIELIAFAGSQMGFSREEIALIDLGTLMQLCSNKTDPAHVRSVWQETIDHNRQQKSFCQRIALPPVITSSRDLTAVGYYESYPNFVTHKRVEGPVINITQIDYKNIPDLTDKIILLENADPGYDWIFTRRLKGIITKYGGVASHMAIRCSEFALPAAIGCGDILFDQVKAAQRVCIDCAAESINLL